MPVTQAARAAGRSVFGFGESAKATLIMLASMVGGFFHDDLSAREMREYAYGQEQTVLTIVTVAAVAVVGTLIIGEIDAALPSPNNSDLNTASEDLITGVGDAMGLLPVVFIVLVAALVIGVVRNFR